MASLWHIGEAPAVRLEALNEMGLGRTILTAKPHLLPLSELVAADSAPGFLIAHQGRTHAPPPLQIYSAKDLHVSLIGMAHVEDRLLHAPDILPKYVGDLFGSAPGLFGLGGEVTQEVERIACVFHVQKDYYGHFLLEMLPKLYVLSQVADKIGNPPIALPANCPAYMVEMMRSIHPTAHFIDLAGKSLRAAQVFLPSMCNIEYRYNSGWTAALRSFATACEIKIGPSPEKIYLTRSGWGSSTFLRRIENEEQIIARLIEKGFSIIAPHTLTWEQKAAAFSSAHTIVGEFGSGLHNTILSPMGTRVVALNWCNEVQQQLAHSCGHVLSVLLPTDGRPRRPSDADADGTSYSIDLDALDATLTTLGL